MLQTTRPINIKKTVSVLKSPSLKKLSDETEEQFLLRTDKTENELPPPPPKNPFH